MTDIKEYINKLVFIPFTLLPDDNSIYTYGTFEYQDRTYKFTYHGYECSMEEIECTSHKQDYNYSSRISNNDGTEIRFMSYDHRDKILIFKKLFNEPKERLHELI